MAESAEVRSVRVEDFLAARLEELRLKHGWSYGDLSQRMADAGVPIERSSLQKIEKGKPRRKIGVNELVGFSSVFNIPVPDLLISPSYRSDKMFAQDMKDGIAAAQRITESEVSLGIIIDRIVEACLDDQIGPDREAALRRDFEVLAASGAGELQQAVSSNGDPDPYGRGGYDPATGLSDWYEYADSSHFRFLKQVLDRLEQEKLRDGKGK